MIDKNRLVDTSGRPLTQSLFLELGYNDYSVYTLKDADHEWNDKKYPSIKRLYLEMEDTTEYEFAKTYLLGWKHWIRLCENKQIMVHIAEWREELELKLRARAVKQMLELAGGGNYQAAKWLADRGWDNRGAGRPTNAEKEKHKAIAARVNEEYGADVHRLLRSV
jgi:hypothetical protein